jgi:diguanylate cyclase (GGDEF)-like protein
VTASWEIDLKQNAFINLGLRPPADGAADSPLRSLVGGLLTAIADAIVSEEGAADRALRETFEQFGHDIAAVSDPDDMQALAGACLRAAGAAVERHREREAERRTELARLVALVRDTVTVLAAGEDDPSSRLDLAADRFTSLLQIADVKQLKRRLEDEVRDLRELAATRHRQWRDASAMFETRVATLEKQLAGVQKEATIDPLTGAGNRRSFDAALASGLKTMHGAFVLALFDVDNFKQVNDSHGHVVGDQVLQEVANGIKSCVRGDDVVARIGGDEFALLASGFTLQQAEARLRTVLESLARTFNGSNDLPRVTLSCGIAECSAGDTSKSLTARADRALYDAKHQGKNRVAVRTAPFIRDLKAR